MVLVMVFINLFKITLIVFHYLKKIVISNKVKTLFLILLLPIHFKLEKVMFYFKVTKLLLSLCPFCPGGKTGLDSLDRFSWQLHNL